MRPQARLARLTLVPPLLIALTAGCSRAHDAPHGPAAAEAPATLAPSPTPAPAAAPSPTPGVATPSLNALETGALTRKVIRTAILRVESDDPAAVQRRATEIAEQLGGFVVTSQSRRSATSPSETSSIDVELSLRVPAPYFATALERLRQAAARVIDEKIGGQDITEEYIDLEAELRAKRALASQFLEIMKTAKTVKDALEVEERLGAVRGEIEKLEGRRRFLDNQSGLSTITMNIEHTRPLVLASESGFRQTFRQAGANLVNVSTAILTGTVRVTAWLVPLVGLVVLPLYAAMRLFRKLRRRTPFTAQPGTWLT